MADEAVVEEAQAQQAQQVQVDPAVEQEARRGGWKPQDQYTGSAPWVDAKEFVENGRKVLPHVQREASRLREENRQVVAAYEKQQAELNDMKQQVASLATFRQELAGRERERIRQETIAELQNARANNDPAAEAAALDKLTRPAPAPVVEKPAPVVEKPAPQRATVPQEFIDWQSQNEWWQQDQVLQQAMNVVGADLRAQGKLTGMSLTDQLNTTAKIVLERYAPQRQQQSRAESGSRPSGGGGGGNRQPAEPSYDALSAQAKAECDAQGERLGVIGPKKAYKDINEWRKFYVAELSRYAPGVGYDYRPSGN